jgi:hypothetical protein
MNCVKPAQIQTHLIHNAGCPKIRIPGLIAVVCHCLCRPKQGVSAKITP